MNTRKKAIVYVGVDISKDTFNSAIGKRDGIHTNSTDGFIAFCADLRRVKGVPHVVFEHTGRYSRPLRDFLTENKMGFTLVDPKQARNFVKGDKEAKRLAKTDKIDARMLALMGIRQNLEQTGAADKAQERIIEWQNQRKALVESCSRLKTLRESLADQELLRFNADAIAGLEEAVETCDARIAELIKESPVRSGLVNALMAVHGVGSIVATTLVASIPELGKVNRAKIAAIVGVAPKVAESGKRKAQGAMLHHRRQGISQEDALPGDAGRMPGCSRRPRPLLRKPPRPRQMQEVGHGRLHAQTHHPPQHHRQILPRHIKSLSRMIFYLKIA